MSNRLRNWPHQSKNCGQRYWGGAQMSETVRGRGSQDIRDRGRGRHDVRGRGMRGEWAGMMSKQGEGRYDIRERRGNT